MSLIGELKRRNVIRMAGLYLVAAWLMVQVAETVLPVFDVPMWVLRAIIIVLALGFIPALVFSWVFELTPGGLRRDEGGLPSEGAPRTARRMDRLIVTGLLALVVLLAVERFWPRDTTETRAGPRAATTGPSASMARQPPTATPVAAAPNSIAVLPFVNMSSDPEQEYFSDGLSEELLNQLAQVSQLRVIARTSSFSFRDRQADVATIARILGVAHILEGSVRKSGDRLRITAQLIRASDSSHLWSQSYDRKLAEVFSVQDEIAAEVVSALKLKLLPSQQPTHTQRTHDPAAYEQYMIGMRLLDAAGLPAMRGSADAFERAIALDPKYANAYAGLAFAQGTLTDFAETPAQREQMIEEALATADKAIALAPDLPDGYAARGNTRHRMRWDWAGAQADLERALALNPGDVTTLTVHGPLLFSLGRRAEALAVLRKATIADPLFPEAWSVLARHLAADGQVANARSAFQRAIALMPDHNWANFLLGTLELEDGNLDAAASLFVRAPDQFRFAGMAMLEHTRGNALASQAALDKMKSDYALGFAFQIAQVHAWRGEKTEAIEWLSRGYETRDAGMARLSYDPALDSLREDPRFVALLRKLRFPEPPP